LFLKTIAATGRPLNFSWGRLARVRSRQLRLPEHLRVEIEKTEIRNDLGRCNAMALLLWGGPNFTLRRGTTTGCRRKGIMKRTILIIACLLLQAPTARSTEPLSPIERYRKLEFPPKDENFDRGWKDRVAAEYDVMNSADLTSL